MVGLPTPTSLSLASGLFTSPFFTDTYRCPSQSVTVLPFYTQLKRFSSTLNWRARCASRTKLIEVLGYWASFWCLEAWSHHHQYPNHAKLQIKLLQIHRRHLLTTHVVRSLIAIIITVALTNSRFFHKHPQHILQCISQGPYRRFSNDPIQNVTRKSFPLIWH